MKRIVKDRYKLNNSETKELDRIFDIAGEKCRISYVYAVSLIQSYTYIFFKKITPIEKINKWFYKSYFLEEYKNSNGINFYYMNIAAKYLKEKFNINLNDVKDVLLESLNYAQKKCKEEPFDTLEDYLEYIINKGLEEKAINRVYKWITKE